MNHVSPFKWCHVEAEIILLCRRWYVRDTLSYRERGLHVNHTTIYRWVQRDAPELRSAPGRI